MVIYNPISFLGGKSYQVSLGLVKKVYIFSAEFYPMMHSNQNNNMLNFSDLDSDLLF